MQAQQFSIVDVAFEAVDGAMISEPTQAMKDLAADLFADIKAAFAGKFSDDDFNQKYQGLFHGLQLGLYADAATIACIDLENNFVVRFKVDVTDDNMYKLPDAPEFEYRMYEAISDAVPADEMFAIIPKAAVVATENYEPTDEFINACNDVLEFMRQNYNVGFDINAFDGIAQQLSDTYGVVASIDQSGEKPVMKVIKDSQSATIDLTVDGTAAIADSISEYASTECGKVGTESADAVPGDDKQMQPGNAVQTDDDKAGEQQHQNDEMYSILETEAPVNTEEQQNAKIEAKSAKQAEIAEECARVFGMPNSRFEGIYAIEHMPVAFKNLWVGSTEAAKQAIALKAKELAIATEAANIQFWTKIDFVALEQALIRKAAQPAVESAQTQPVNPLLSLLQLSNNVKRKQ